jgi:nitrogen fixation NifU-like protein
MYRNFYNLLIEAPCGLLVKYWIKNLFMSALSGFKNYSKVILVIICFALALIIGIIRYLTGPEWAISAFFLFPIILVTWKAGIWAGVSISFTSAISWLVADLMMVNVFSNAIIPYLNETFRLLVFMVITFERWQNPLYAGAMDNPDGHGRVTGSCDDTMQVFLKFENNKVKEARFLTDGCGSSTVCGSFAAELALGKFSDELLEITGDTILKILGNFPEEYRHCAFLATDTLQDALHDYMVKGTRNQEEGN